MERWITKVLSMIIIFVVVLFFTLLPIKVHRIFESWGRTGKQIISYFMCFGGGVFLSIYMLHMAPDARELVTKEIIEPNNIDYPLAELLVAIGFFFMVFSENCVLRMYSMWTVEKHDVEVDGGNEIGEKLSKGVTEPLDKPYHHLSLENNLNHGEGKHYHAVSTQEKEPSVKDEENHGHHDLNLSGSRSFILLIALSLHHVFEGMSVGLKHSNAAVWNLTIAIITHEVIIAFSLGLQLVKAHKSTRRVFIAAVLCTCMVPLGIAIGIALSETNKGEMPSIRIANGILQSLATGVFVYVTFFEILADELTHQRPGMMKLVCMLLGFITMALLALIPEDKDTDLELANNSTGIN